MVATPTQVSTSELDAQHLQTLEARITLLRDRVRSVVNRYQVALHIVGRPGIGKSHAVINELSRTVGTQWKLCNARMTPMGLFGFFRDHPDHILVLDDVGGVFDNRAALLILLAAMDGTPDRPREITYNTQSRSESVPFRGGVISISNLPLRNDPLAKALHSRIVVLEHEVGDDEIAALMRQIVVNGYLDLSVVEGLKIVDFVVDACRRRCIRLDLRCLAKVARDYIQCREGHAETPWQELALSSLRGLSSHDSAPPLSKQQQIENQCELLRRLQQQYPNDTKAQLKASRLKKSTYYNRLQAVRQSAPHDEAKLC